MSLLDLSNSLLSRTIQWLSLKEHCCVATRFCKRFYACCKTAESWDPELKLWINPVFRSAVSYEGLRKLAEVMNARPKTLDLVLSEDFPLPPSGPFWSQLTTKTEYLSINKRTHQFDDRISCMKIDRLKTLVLDGNFHSRILEWFLMAPMLEVFDINSTNPEDIPLVSVVYGLEDLQVKIHVKTLGELQSALQCRNLTSLSVVSMDKDVKIESSKIACKETLTELDLTRFSFQKTLHLHDFWQHMVQFTNLSTIRCHDHPYWSNDQLVIFPPNHRNYLTDMQNLTRLHLNIAGSLPCREVPVLDTMQNLKHLHIRFQSHSSNYELDHLMFNVTLLNTFQTEKKWTNLEDFQIVEDDNVPDQSISEILKRMPNLTSFGMCSMTLSTDILSSLQNLKRLQTLRLCMNSPLSNLTRDLVQKALPDVKELYDEKFIEDVTVWKKCLFCYTQWTIEPRQGDVCANERCKKPLLFQS